MNKLIVCLLVFMLSGCAVHFTDNQGKDNYFGFVSITTEESRCIVTNTTKSVGLTIDTTKESGGVNLGFRTISKSYIRKGALVEIEVIREEHTYPTKSTPKTATINPDTLRVTKADSLFIINVSESIH